MDRAYLGEYADSNGLIVLYPQATASSWTGGDPDGCWNRWRFGGDTSYGVKAGKQLQAIVAMALGGQGRARVTWSQPNRSGPLRGRR